MSFNGSGTFNINSTGQPVVAGTVISSTTFNALTSDLANGLSTCITKDGQTAITANISLNTFKITNLGAGTAATDAVRLGQLQNGAATVVTVTGTDTYTGTMSPALTAYGAGNTFTFVVPNTNTTSCTLNIDGLGAKALTRDGSTALVAGDLVAGSEILIVYDGTRFQVLNSNSKTSLILTNPLAVTSGGTGQSSYTNGQLLIGNTTGNTLTKGTLTAGSGVSITNGGGTITISATGSGGTVTAVTATSPVQSTGGTAPIISMPVATGSVDGYLSSADWTTFNNKGSGTVTSVTATSPVASTGGATPVISMPAATTSVSGYLTAADWTTFNNKGSGTVTAVSVVSANGFAGSSSGGATPALTLSTSITGLLKGNGTAISAASSGTDYAPATSGSSILYGNGAGGFSNVTIGSGLSFSTGTLSSTAGGGTVTSVGQTFTGGLIAVSGSPVTGAGTLALTVAGTSGGIPYFSSASTWATSAALAANSLVVGGGAGVAPATTTTGTGVVTAVGNAVNTTGGLVTQSGTLAASALLLGGGSATAITSTTTGTGVVTALGNNANATGGFTTINGTATLTNKRIDPRVTSAASAATLTPDISAADQYCYTALAANLTINAPTGTPVDGDKLIFRLLDNGTTRTLTWNATYTVIGVTLPTATTANKTVYVGCVYNANNTRWDVIAVTTQA